VLAGCHNEEKAAAPAIRPVRTVTVQISKSGDTLSLTGEIQPRYQTDIGFRVNGKILERPVDVGTEGVRDAAFWLLKRSGRTRIRGSLILIGMSR
jgi:hypothetical protein